MAAEVASFGFAPGPPVEGMHPTSMEHPPSPLDASMIPNQDGHSPNSPSDRHPHMGHHDPSMSMGYRPPPGAYGAPGGYPPYPPYGPPQGPYGSPPPHGYPHPGSPGGYPGHHQSYGYGYNPAHAPRPPYGYGYEGGYPGQQTRKSPPFRGNHGGPHHRQAPPSQQQPQQSAQQGQSSQSQLLVSPQKGSPTGKTSPTRSSDLPVRPPKLSDHVEVERLRAAAATEITHAEVKPIRTDFHFFVQENKEKYLKLAEDEVRRTSNAEKLDPFLVNSNLNTRIMKAWEDLKEEERDAFMIKEEEDRRRFMEEDEIASRHCATLTARGKSPRSSDKDKQDKVKKEERQERETKPATTPDREAPSKDKKPNVSPDGDDKEHDDDDDEDSSAKDDDRDMMHLEGTKKRLTSATSSPITAFTTETHESPAKRNRVADEVMS